MTTQNYTSNYIQSVQQPSATYAYNTYNSEWADSSEDTKI